MNRDASLPMRGSWVRRFPRAGHRRVVVVNVGKGPWKVRSRYRNLSYFLGANSHTEMTMDDVLKVYGVLTDQRVTT